MFFFWVSGGGRRVKHRLLVYDYDVREEDAVMPYLLKVMMMVIKMMW